MQVSKEFLLEAVGLSLLVGLLLLGVQMFERATGIIAVFDREQEQQLAYMQEYEITQYEDRIIDGVTAVNYIKNMVYHYEIGSLLETERGTVMIDKEMCKKLKDVESEYYINPFGLYECAIVREENGNVEYVYVKAKEGECNE